MCSRKASSARRSRPVTTARIDQEDHHSDDPRASATAGGASGLPPFLSELMQVYTPNVATIPEIVARLLKELAGRYVYFPKDIKVEFQEAKDGSCYFVMQGNPVDDPRLIGRQGDHVDALSCLVERVGKAFGRYYTFRLLSRRGQSATTTPTIDALEYDARPDRDFLCEWLKVLGANGYSVDLTPGDGPRTKLTFNFNVTIPDRQLVVDFMMSEAKPHSMSVINAIGTLYRAIAKQKGVKFQVNLL